MSALWKILGVNIGVWIFFFMLYSLVMTFTVLAELRHYIESISDWIERFVVLPVLWGSAMAAVTTVTLFVSAKLFGEKSKSLPLIPIVGFGAFC